MAPMQNSTKEAVTNLPRIPETHVDYFFYMLNQSAADAAIRHKV